jgi:cyanophycinase-like exopeptidase
VALLGSGETSPSGGRVFEAIVNDLTGPPNVAVLETPAGFELNSAQVAGRVAGFLRQRLQNYQPEILVVPARKRHTAFSPDDPALTRPMLNTNLIFAGPGSPTYAVRQLRDSRAWHTLTARHRLGATLVFASAATTAVGAQVLPVYEIYKVGEEPHWRPGLDFFGAYGLSLVLIPHWNNAEGGGELDTSRCFMGEARFAELMALLPEHVTVVGIDEHSGLVIDFAAAQAEVMGRGGVTVLRARREGHFDPGERFPLTALGSFCPCEPTSGIPTDIWEEALSAQASTRRARPSVPDEVMALVEDRQAARVRRDWAVADVLRERIAAVGWSVLDTPEGPRLEPR